MEAGSSTFTFYSPLTATISGNVAVFTLDPIDANGFLNKTMYAKKYQIRLKDFSFCGSGIGDTDDELYLDLACYLDGFNNTNQYTVSSADVNYFQLPISTLTVMTVQSVSVVKGNNIHYHVSGRRDSSSSADLIVDRTAFESTGRIIKPVVYSYIYAGSAIWDNLDFRASLILEISPIY